MKSGFAYVTPLLVALLPFGRFLNDPRLDEWLDHASPTHQEVEV